MNDYEELTDWIKTNAGHLASYTTHEIANLAIAAGFSRSAVAQWEIHQQYKKEVA